MPTFTVSLIASIPVSAQVVIEADNEAQALAIAQQMHQRAQLGWTYNGLPIPTFTGPVASIWSNPGVIAPPGPKKVSIVLVVNPTTVPFGSPVICTATVAPGATGLVSFYDGLTLICTAVPNGFGIATLSGVELPIGVQEIVAKFAGDIYFAAGISNTVRVVVTPPATATVCIGSPNPQDFGSVVHITATTTSAFGVPTGLVIFYDGATQIGSARLSAGTCNINTAALPLGSNILTAVYQGSCAPHAGFAGSTSPPFTEVILAVNIPTTTTVMSSQPSAPHGTLVTFTASVNSAAGPPTAGTVTFVAIPSSGPPITLGSPSVNGSGVASVSTSTLPNGTYTIQATYNGTSGFLPSVGTTAQDISAGAPAEAITITPPGPNGYVSNIGITVSIDMVLSGIPTPTGTVTLFAGLSSGWPGNAMVVPGGMNLPLTAGAYDYTTNSSGANPGVFTAGYSYSGDGNWSATPLSASPNATLTFYSDLVTEDPFTITPSTWTTGDVGTSTLALTVNPPPNGLVSSPAGVTPTGSIQLLTLSPSLSFAPPWEPFGFNISAITNHSGNYQITTSVPNPFVNGQAVFVHNVVGTGANGNWVISVLDSSNFVLTGSTYAGGWTPNTGTAGSTFFTLSGGAVSAILSHTTHPFDGGPDTYGVTAVYSGDANYLSCPPTLTVTNVTSNGGAIQITTSQAHNFATTASVFISGVVGVPANGYWPGVTVVDAHNFTLGLSVFSGSYSSGGTVQSVQIMVNNVTGIAGVGSAVELQLWSPHPFVTGSTALVADIGGPTEANGFWTVTVIDSTHITLDGSVYSGTAYTPGTGTVVIDYPVTIGSLLLPFVDPAWSLPYVKDDGTVAVFQTAKVSSSSHEAGIFCTVTNGSALVPTDGDLTPWFSNGTQIIFAVDGTSTVYTVQSITSSQITLTGNYTGTSSSPFGTVVRYNASQPTGTFQFTINGTNYGSPQALSGITAIMPNAVGGVSPLTPNGSFVPGGMYSGDSTYQPSGPNGSILDANLIVYHATPQMSLSTQLLGTFNVQNGQTIIPTTMDQTSVFAGGEQVQFSSQPGQNYTVSSVGLTSVHITLNSAYTGTNDTVAIASVTHVQTSSGENIPLLAFLGCNESPFGPTPTGTIQMYYNDPGHSTGWVSVGSPVSLSPDINTFTKAQVVLNASSNPPYDSNSPGTYFSYSFTSGDSHYNNVGAPTGGPPPTAPNVNFSFIFTGAG